MARSLGGDEENVDVRRGMDLAEVDVEAVAEGQGHPGTKMGGDLVLVDLRLFFIGEQDHHEVGLLDGIGDGDRRESEPLGLALGASLADADGHVDSGFLEVEGMGVALASKANDRHLLGPDPFEIDVGFIVDRRFQGSLHTMRGGRSGVRRTTLADPWGFCFCIVFFAGGEELSAVLRHRSQAVISLSWRELREELRTSSRAMAIVPDLTSSLIPRGRRRAIIASIFSSSPVAIRV